MARELTQTGWKLTHFVVNKALQPVIPGTTLTAMFGDHGNVAGSGGCNVFTADYKILLRNPPGIVISQLAHTMKHCSTPPGVMDQEERYFESLLAATDIDCTPDRLELSWQNNGLVFEAEELKKY